MPDSDEFVYSATSSDSCSSSSSEERTREFVTKRLGTTERSSISLKTPLKSFQALLHVTDVETSLAVSDKKRKKEKNLEEKMLVETEEKGKKRKEASVKIKEKKRRKKETDGKGNEKKVGRKKKNIDNDEDYEIVSELNEKKHLEKKEAGGVVSAGKATKIWRSMRVRTTPKPLCAALKSLNKNQKKVLEEMGFGKLFGMVCDGVTAKLGHYVVDSFDTINMCLKTKNGPVNVTCEIIHFILGVPLGGIDIFSLESCESTDPSLVQWNSQFVIKDIRPNDIFKKIVGSDDCGQLFKLNFLMLFLNSVVDCKGSGVCKLNVLPYLCKVEKFEDLDWCKLIFDSLRVSKLLWKANDSTNFYTGPVLLLALVYFEFVHCKGFGSKPKCPALKYWTVERMRERESFEISNGGFGIGEVITDCDLNTLHESCETENHVLNIESKFQAFEDAVYDAFSKFPTNDKVISWKKKLDLMNVSEDNKALSIYVDPHHEDVMVVESTTPGSLTLSVPIVLESVEPIFIDPLDISSSPSIVQHVCIEPICSTSGKEIIEQKVEAVKIDDENVGEKVDYVELIEKVVEENLGLQESVKENVAPKVNDDVEHKKDDKVSEPIVDPIVVKVVEENVAQIVNDDVVEQIEDDIHEAIVEPSFAFREPLSGEGKGLSSLECSNPILGGDKAEEGMQIVPYSGDKDSNDSLAKTLVDLSKGAPLPESAPEKSVLALTSVNIRKKRRTPRAERVSELDTLNEEQASDVESSDLDKGKEETAATSSKVAKKKNEQAKGEEKKMDVSSRKTISEQNRLNEEQDNDVGTKGLDKVEKKQKSKKKKKKILVTSKFVSKKNSDKEPEKASFASKKRYFRLLGQEGANLESGPLNKKRKKKIERANDEDKKNKYKGKVHSIRIRTSPKPLCYVLNHLNLIQREALVEIGFGNLKHMILDGVTSKLGHFVVDRFDPVTMSIKLKYGEIKINSKLIHDMIGIPYGGVDIESLQSFDNVNSSLLRKWLNQFDDHFIRPNDIVKRILKSDDAGFIFKLNFIVLFYNIMVECWGSGVCKIDFVSKIVRGEGLVDDVDWCATIEKSLSSSKQKWKRNDLCCFYCGPISVLALAYLDYMNCPNFVSIRLRPAIKFWSMEKMRERESVEIENGGFGIGDVLGDVDSTVSGLEDVHNVNCKTINLIKFKEDAKESTNKAFDMFPEIAR